MRISDWSSDVCASDLMIQLQHMGKMLLVVLTAPLGMIGVTAIMLAFRIPFGFVAMLGVLALFGIDRKSVVSGTSVSVRVDLGRRCIIKKKNNIITATPTISITIKLCTTKS